MIGRASSILSLASTLAVLAYAFDLAGRAPARSAFHNRATVVALVIAALWWTWRARRRAGTWTDLVATGLAFFFGLAIVLLMLVHLATIVALRLSASTPFHYDFRFYSLVLTGVAILLPGLVLLRAASGLAVGDADARRWAWRAVLALLALNLPLIPLQGFALGFSGGAGATALALVGARGSPDDRA